MFSSGSKDELCENIRILPAAARNTKNYFDLLEKGCKAYFSAFKVGKEEYELVSVEDANGRPAAGFVLFGYDKGLLTLQDFVQSVQTKEFNLHNSENPERFLGNFFAAASVAEKEDVTARFKKELAESFVWLAKPLYELADNEKEFYAALQNLKKCSSFKQVGFWEYVSGSREGVRVAYDGAFSYEMMKTAYSTLNPSSKHFEKDLYKTIEFGLEEIISEERKEFAKEQEQLDKLPVYARIWRALPKVAGMAVMVGAAGAGLGMFSKDLEMKAGAAGTADADYSITEIINRTMNCDTSTLDANPNAENIVFTCKAARNVSKIYSIDITDPIDIDGQLTLIGSQEDSAVSLKISPDGKYFALANNTHIRIAPMVGYPVQRVFLNGLLIKSPINWKHDGESVTYVANSDNSPYGSVYQYTLGDSEPTIVPTNNALEHMPVWTPEGNIIYISYHYFYPVFSSISQYNFGNDSVDTLHYVGEYMTNLDLSADGKNVVFFKYLMGQYGNHGQTELLNLETKKITVLSKENPAPDGLKFSPNGSRIAVTESSAIKIFDINRSDINGTGVKTIPIQGYNTRWLSDNSLITSASDSNNIKLYKIDLDKSPQQNQTQNNSDLPDLSIAKLELRKNNWEGFYGNETTTTLNKNDAAYIGIYDLPYGGANNGIYLDNNITIAYATRIDGGVLTHHSGINVLRMYDLRAHWLPLSISNLSYGNHTITAVIDIDNNITESDETNNEKSLEFTIIAANQTSQQNNTPQSNCSYKRCIKLADPTGDVDVSDDGFFNLNPNEVDIKNVNVTDDGITTKLQFSTVGNIQKTRSTYYYSILIGDAEVEYFVNDAGQSNNIFYADSSAKSNAAIISGNTLTATLDSKKIDFTKTSQPKNTPIGKRNGAVVYAKTMMEVSGYDSESSEHTGAMDDDTSNAILTQSQQNQTPESPQASELVVHLSDTHIGAQGADLRLEQMVSKILAFRNRPKFVVVSGDIVDFGYGDGGAANYQRFLELVAPLENKGIKILTVPGNHDYRSKNDIIGSNPYVGGIEDIIKTRLQNYKDIVGDRDITNKAVDAGDFVIVGLDSGHDRINDVVTIDLHPEGSGLHDSDVWRLENALDNLDGIKDQKDLSGKRKIIVLHHPAYRTWVKEFQQGDTITNNKDIFLELAKKYSIDAVLAGHSHENSFVTNENTDHVQTASVAYEGTWRNVTFLEKNGAVDYTVYKPQILGKMISVSTGSPVGLHVYDKNGKRVAPDVSSSFDINNDGSKQNMISVNYAGGLKFRVIGTKDAKQNSTYNLEAMLNSEDENAPAISSHHIKINAGEVHEYNIDWGKVKSNSTGAVKMRIDSHGDGVFEKTIHQDNQITPEELTQAMQQQTNNPLASRLAGIPVLGWLAAGAAAIGAAGAGIYYRFGRKGGGQKEIIETQKPAQPKETWPEQEFIEVEQKPTNDSMPSGAKQTTQAGTATPKVLKKLKRVNDTKRIIIDGEELEREEF